MPQEIEKLFQNTNIYSDLYSINIIKLKENNLFGITMREKDKNQKEKKRRIEIIISSEPKYYEIKTFNINNCKEDNFEDQPLYGLKTEGCLDVDEFINDLKDIIQNEEKFKFYPNFPL